MTLFQYPKNKHSRKLSPRQFKRYQTYKRFLQTEFARVCVYCRQPDSSAPNLNFGVDHYKPKGIPRFANLVCAYKNLYYCCGSCNSRKTNYWALDEKVGPHIVNPCDYEMAAHLRFDSDTGQVVTKTPHGKLTEELLQLNDHATVQYRLSTLRIVRLFSTEIEQLERQLKEIARRLRDGKISQVDHDTEAQAINKDLTDLRCTMRAQTGELPLPPLQMQRLALSLIAS